MQWTALSMCTLKQRKVLSNVKQCAVTLLTTVPRTVAVCCDVARRLSPDVERAVHVQPVGTAASRRALPRHGLPESLQQRARRAVLHPRQVHAARSVSAARVHVHSACS